MPKQPNNYRGHNTGNRQPSNDEIIIDLIEAGSTVLDLGCGEGELLQRLIRDKQVAGRGVDIEEAKILACVKRGISVFQGNLDEGLKDYATNSYDYVILNQTLQVTHNPILVLREMMRVGKKGIVSFPNFGFLYNRLQLLFAGRMPVNRKFPFTWYNTPNIHFFTRKDFFNTCIELGFQIEQEIPTRNGKPVARFFAGSMANEVCYVLTD